MSYYYHHDAKPRLSKSAMLGRAEKSLGDGVRITDHRVVARNTIEFSTDDGRRILRYHDTNIVTAYPDGRIVVDSGGWNTPSTRSRIDGFKISGLVLTARTKNNSLYLGYNTGGFFNKARCASKITILPNGAIESDFSEKELDDNRKSIERFIDAWKKRGLPSNHDGDPWIFTTPDKIEPYIIQEWVNSKYVFRNYLIYAMRFNHRTYSFINHTLKAIDRDGGRLDNLSIRDIRKYTIEMLNLGR